MSDRIRRQPVLPPVGKALYDTQARTVVHWDDLVADELSLNLHSAGRPHELVSEPIGEYVPGTNIFTTVFDVPVNAEFPSLAMDRTAEGSALHCFAQEEQE